MKSEASTRMYAVPKLLKSTWRQEEAGMGFAACCCYCCWSLMYWQPCMVETGLTHSLRVGHSRSREGMLMKAFVLHCNVEEGK